MLQRLVVAEGFYRDFVTIGELDITFAFQHGFIKEGVVMPSFTFGRIHGNI